MRQPARLLVPIVVTLFVVLLGGRAIASFYTEALWFADTGYGPVFWTRVVTEITVRAAATVVAAGIMLVNLWVVARRLGPVHVRRCYGNLEISEQIPRRVVLIGITLTAILAGWWLASIKYGGGQSLNLLTALRRASFGVNDPLFGNDLSFYMFALPAYLQLIDFLLLAALWTLILSVLGYNLVGGVRWQQNRVTIDRGARMHAVWLFATLLLLT